MPGARERRCTLAWTLPIPSRIPAPTYSVPSKCTVPNSHPLWPSVTPGESCITCTSEARKLGQKGAEGLDTVWGPRRAGNNCSQDRRGSWPETGARSLGLEQLGRVLPRGQGQGTRRMSRAGTDQPGRPMAVWWGSRQPPGDTPWLSRQPPPPTGTRPVCTLSTPANPSAKDGERQ